MCLSLDKFRVYVHYSFDKQVLWLGLGEGQARAGAGLTADKGT